MNRQTCPDWSYSERYLASCSRLGFCVVHSKSTQINRQIVQWSACKRRRHIEAKWLTGTELTSGRTRKRGGAAAAGDAGKTPKSRQKKTKEARPSSQAGYMQEKRSHKARWWDWSRPQWIPQAPGCPSESPSEGFPIPGKRLAWRRGRIPLLQLHRLDPLVLVNIFKGSPVAGGINGHLLSRDVGWQSPRRGVGAERVCAESRSAVFSPWGGKMAAGSLSPASAK